MAVLKFLVNSMSFNRRYAVSKLEELADPITEHIVKILIMKSNAKLQKQWEQELNAWLRRISNIKLKSSNRGIPSTLIVQELTDITFFDHPELLIAWIPDEESQLETYSYFISNPSQLVIAVRAIITEFANESENRTFIAIQRLRAYQDTLDQRNKE